MKTRLTLFLTTLLAALAITATAPADSCAAGYKPACGNGGWHCIYVGYIGPNGEPWYCYDPAYGGWTWRW